MKTAQELIGEVWASVQRTQRQIEADAAAADPRAHRLSTVFKGKPLSYRHWGWIKRRGGKRVRFCWSCHRNVAGYFVGWRETETPVKRKGPPKPGDLLATIKRDQWTARKVKKRLEELQDRRTNALRGG